jgi:hypothetical protein
MYKGGILVVVVADCCRRIFWGDSGSGVKAVAAQSAADIVDPSLRKEDIDNNSKSACQSESDGINPFMVASFRIGISEKQLTNGERRNVCRVFKNKCLFIQKHQIPIIAWWTP